jgi:hypothetical protein
MVCTRCQQREAMRSPLPDEKRARVEELLGAPWPFPEGLCEGCLKEVGKTPEYRERLERFTEAASAKTRAELVKAVRSTALKVLDFADRIANGI